MGVIRNLIHWGIPYSDGIPCGVTNFFSPSAAKNCIAGDEQNEGNFALGWSFRKNLLIRSVQDKFKICSHVVIFS